MRNKWRITPEPGITPLVDVLLILLVIVLASIPAIIKSVTYDLPKSGGDPLSATPALEITLAANGQIELRGARLTLESLNRQKIEGNSALIKATPQVSLEFTLQVATLLKEKGITSLVFATVDKKE